MLRRKGYVFIVDNGCFGDQLWVHASLAQSARERLRLHGSNVTAGEERDDFSECCHDGHRKYVRGATIDNGCCAAPDKSECVRQLGTG